MIVIYVFASLILFLSRAQAQDIKIDENHIIINIEQNGNYTEEVKITASPLTLTAVDRLYRIHIPIRSDTIENRVVYAYSFDKVGQRLRASITTSKSETIIQFDGLSVGGKILYDVEMRKKPPYPRKPSLSYTFTQKTVSPATIEITRPKEMMVYYDLQGLVKAGSFFGKLNTVSDRFFVRSEANSTENPYFSMSTMVNYEELARIYLKISEENIGETKTIRPLAQAIGVSAVGTEATVRRVMEWMRENIKYYASPFDIGIYPRSPLDVLNSKQGDCKDQVLLLQSILADLHIDSLPVLLTGRNSPMLGVPTWQKIKHVILYLPQLKKFIDPTNRTGSFDNLQLDDFGVEGLVVSKNPRLIEIPHPESTEVTAEWDLQGNILSGKMYFNAHGIDVNEIYQFQKLIEEHPEQETVKNALKSFGMLNASGNAQSIKQAGEKIFKFTFQGEINSKKENAFPLILTPIFILSSSPIGFVKMGMMGGDNDKSYCRTRKYKEKFILKSNKDIAWKNTLQNVQYQSPFTIYKVGYKLEKNYLIIERTIESNYEKATCNTSVFNAEKKLKELISADITNGILISTFSYASRMRQ